jgi:hypothetical protein
MAPNHRCRALRSPATRALVRARDRFAPLVLCSTLLAGCTGTLDYDGDSVPDDSSPDSGARGGGPARGGGFGMSGAGANPAAGGNSSEGGAGSGAAGTSAAGSAATPAPATNPAAFGSCPTNPEAGVTPLLKLSTVQYRNTVRDLLTASGLTAVVNEVQATLDSVPDDGTLTFRGLDRRISSEHVTAYFNVAVAVGDAATRSPERLTALAGSCASTTPLSSACLDGLLAGFGRRAFRRPLTDEERTAYRDIALGTSPKADTSAEAVRNVVVAMLMSPRLVNHLELEGPAIAGRDDYFVLDGYAVASRLSYTFWQTAPDDELLEAAADGTLEQDAGFEAQLARVFSDARTRNTLWQFWNEWLRFESFTGFAADRPGFRALAAGEPIGEAGHDHWGDMVQEIRDLTELYTWKQPGTFRDLMTSTVSVTPSPDLARLYGVTAWSGSAAYPAFSDGNRAGLLQRGALLASTLETTNPFHRGALIRRSLLCDALPSPDPNSLPPGSLDTPPVDAALTTRKRFEAKVAGNALCAGCHSMFSDIGYVMEAFDSLGRFRTTENVFDEQTGELVATLPIDTRAMVQLADGDRREIIGPMELNQMILESGKVQSCLSANYFRYALRRDPTSNSADACSYKAVRDALDEPGVGLAEAFRRIGTDTGFRQRKVGSR